MDQESRGFDQLSTPLSFSSNKKFPSKLISPLLHAQPHSRHKVSNFAREAEKKMTTLSVILAGKEKIWSLFVKGLKGKTHNPR